MRTAIDIVLLPSAQMTAKAIEINRALLKTDESKIELDEQTCLPHISLCMGVIDSADLPKVEAVLQAIAQETRVFILTAERIRASIIQNGKTVSGIDITNTAYLQKAQADIMDGLWPYLTYDLDASMFHSPMEVEDITFSWVEGYAKVHDDSSLFHPHMTVGFGETNDFDDEFPMQFTAPTLALCQLGNYCTCRKVLSKFELDSAK